MSKNNGQAKGSQIELTDLTPTENRIWKLLSDNKAHTREEIHGCLWDEMSNLATIQYHISNLRGKVKRIDWEIILELRGFQKLYRRIPILP